MKKTYKNPELFCILFEKSDIITASNTYVVKADGDGDFVDLSLF